MLFFKSNQNLIWKMDTFENRVCSNELFYTCKYLRAYIFENLCFWVKIARLNKKKFRDMGLVSLRYTLFYRETLCAIYKTVFMDSLASFANI